MIRWTTSRVPCRLYLLYWYKLKYYAEGAFLGVTCVSSSIGLLTTELILSDLISLFRSLARSLAHSVSRSFALALARDILMDPADVC
jgi:hypothetical protein